ncbi:MAG: DNA mismatch repair protein MutS [Alistipes sp.]|nr:DNA mismatch repair protein MutS [Alistipes sp.]
MAKTSSKETKKETKYVETPLMKQYYQMKALHSDAILLFRIGDFYETFGEDAILTSKILGITLTRRANGAAAYVELAGFPHHALDTYLPKLVRAGERVAICEQLEDPKTAKSIVKRGVIELVTPGVSFSDNVLNCKENNFLAAVLFGKSRVGVAFLDVSTGEFYAAEGEASYVDKLLANLSPKEIIYPKGYESEFTEAFGSKYYTYRLDPWMFTESSGREKLQTQFGTTSLKGFGIDTLHAAVAAAGAVLYYLEFTEHRNTQHISAISRIDEDRFVWIDKFSIRNLELFTPNGGAEGQSLFDVMDRTASPMGARMLRRWISLPLKEVEAIRKRQEVVALLRERGELRELLYEAIGTIGDLERIISRIAVGRVTPREVVQLKQALYAIEKMQCELQKSDAEPLQAIAQRLELCLEVRDRIDREVYPDPSNQIQKGGVIAPGVSIELDDLRNVAAHGKEILSSIQQRESEATGIPSLKISFNNVFGYYIEVRNAHKDKVPESWIRKQTLTGAERYITSELKEYEEKILGAESRILVLEQELFAALLQALSQFTAKIQGDAAQVAQLDCLLSFASLSLDQHYCRPEVNDSALLDIRQGRHPVIETLMKVGESYIPNDVRLDDSQQQIIIITGPNMSGKSALLRQTALIVLMAQIGSDVPATEAHIGIVDKIFTRVGASDNISQGESTFMVEMLESASILNNLSPRSLVLLDEIGRGTSTYDGISIAWAMVEYIHQHPSARAKTLFATHYHELNEMAELYPRIQNFNVAVKELNRKVIFLRKLVPGGTEHSFGIHVAKMAGMPGLVIDRANRILQELEAKHRGKLQDSQPVSMRGIEPAMGGVQLSMFQLDDPVLKQIRDEIRGLDINALTPLEALNKLNEIKKITGL